MEDIEGLVRWTEKRASDREINYRPARVLMQDFTGVPGVVDLAAMRDAIAKAGGDPQRINPLAPVDLVIDHSVMVDEYGTPQSFSQNVEREYERNKERYQFLRWGQNAFNNFRVVPPGTGICHQVNLEYLGRGVWYSDTEDGKTFAYPDTLVGTDSHTTMINGLGVLGWGVGGIEAEAAMLGQPVAMLIPEVVGFKITGKMREGMTATDLVLTVTEMLRSRGVVGKFVEFFGDGLADLSLADRATIGNMAPEYGATCGFFPIDERTIEYLELTNRPKDDIALVEAYCKAQGLWRSSDDPDPEFSDVLELDLDDVVPSLAGPKRPQDRVPMTEVKRTIIDVISQELKLNDEEISKLEGEGGQTAIGNHEPGSGVEVTMDGKTFHLDHGDVVIAAITSCTNTSNPSVMMAAGLMAQKAVEKGLTRKPWVKTSLAPGSKVVTDYLNKAGLQDPLNQIGFDLVGYGCTTCIGNSGPLPDEIDKAIAEGDLVVASVLSGNRNFDGRIHPYAKQAFLASPPLVVAYAIAGTIRFDIEKDVLGHDADGKPIMLKDIWPDDSEIDAIVKSSVKPEQFRRTYIPMFEKKEGGAKAVSPLYDWRPQSTYIRRPPYWEGTMAEARALKNMRPLAVLPDNITTDHLSPSNAILLDSAAGAYLHKMGLPEEDFNSYATHRGDHLTAQRATLANPKLFNEMVRDEDGNVIQGSLARVEPEGEVMRMWEAIETYMERKQPLIIIAGADYGQGSSRDWAAKGVALAGVEAIVAEGFERIHRTNLIGMGVMPLQFQEGTTRHTLGIDGTEVFDVEGEASPRAELTLVMHRANGDVERIPVICRLDTAEEVSVYSAGGILQRFAKDFMQAAS